MTLVSLFFKVALPVSVLATTSLITSITHTPKNDSTQQRLAPPDSTLKVPIAVVNKDRLPTVVVEKEVDIPKGYAYVQHSLSLVSAFPIEGAEQATDWIAGPNKSWSIYAKLEVNCKQPDRIAIRATAAPGRKNEEIGAQAVLLVGIRKLGNAN